MELRSYQQQDKENIYAMWSWGFKYVLYTLPPGGGKTVVFSSILKDSTGISVVIAHRLEILSQISRALAINKVLHSLIGPEKLNRIFKKLHREELGRSWIASNARVYVASVDTLKARISRLKDWGVQISLWVHDEAHHVLNDNKWGEVTRLFPNARGLGVTATPLRADKRSLKLGKGGVFQKLIIGPDYRTLIDQEYLTDYHIFAPLSNIDIKSLRITKSGDFNKLHLTSAARKSRIVGDVVTQYLKIAPGEQGATFVTDVKTAKDLEGQFRLQGVPAVALSAKSTIKDRVEAFRAFKDKKLLQLLNVDLFGEGVDLPALQFVCFARPTASYGLYCQQFGRVLRPYKGG
jgi:superfamily II DNA or RNA helicase